MSKENKFNFTDERLRKIDPAPAVKRIYYHDQTTPGLMPAITATGRLLSYQAELSGDIQPNR